MTTVTLRPVPRWYARTLLRHACNVANFRFLCAGLLVAALFPGVALWVPVALALPTASALLFAVVYSLRVRVSIDGDLISCRGMVRRSTFQRAQIARRIFHDFSRGAEPNPILILIDHDRRRLLTLHTSYWHDGALDVLLWYLDVPPVARWSRAAKSVVAREHAGAIHTVGRIARGALAHTTAGWRIIQRLNGRRSLAGAGLPGPPMPLTLEEDGASWRWLDERVESGSTRAPDLLALPDS
ncbi:MAG TPA: hypothetical protein VKX16_08630 [Chloroflexota bacterium]|nr:hypothetical protein [Chloroflexota bacterium]